MYNKVILVGNMTRDIELRYSQGGSAIANTALATSRKYTVNGEKREDVCFIDITFFGRSAEIANQYLNKGSKVLVEGRLNFEQWSDQSGQKRSKHTVIVEEMKMLDSKPQDTSTGASYNTQSQGHGMNSPVAYENAPMQQQAPRHTDYQPQNMQQRPTQQPMQQQRPQYNPNQEEIPF